MQKLNPKAVPYLRALLFVAIGGIVFNYTDLKKRAIDYINKQETPVQSPVDVDVKVNGKNYYIKIVHQTDNVTPTPPIDDDKDDNKKDDDKKDDPKPVVNRFIFHTVSDHTEVKNSMNEPIKSIILSEQGWVELGKGGNSFSAHDLKAKAPLVEKYVEAANLEKVKAPFLVVFNGDKIEKGYLYLGPVPKTLEERKTLVEKLQKGQKVR